MKNDLQAVGLRLKTERERLGLSQDHLAEHCGVTRPTQYRYESGKGSPTSEYLDAAAKIGVNVQFVLVGSGTLPVKLSTKETALIDLFRLSKPSIQDAVIKLLKNQDQKSTAKPRKPAAVVQTVRGSRNISIGVTSGGVRVK
jgi:transcriptional regulator with XRE-family HTH domain